MKVLDKLRDFLGRHKYNVLGTYGVTNWGECSRFQFGEGIFRNIVELLTDVSNDVEWISLSNGQSVKFAEFCTFFERDAKQILWRYFKNGFAVIGEKNGQYRLLDSNEYYQTCSLNKKEIFPLDKEMNVYVFVSDLYKEEGKSDYQICLPYIKYLDNILNASNTSTEKLGTFIVATPETPNGSPVSVSLNEEQKDALEKQIQNDYGALSTQKHIMLLPRGMNFQTVSLEGVNRDIESKVRMAILFIADRIKVPANQIAMIDAESSKALSNGSEIKAGDLMKYKSFERLLNNTFVNFTKAIDLKTTYSVYNKSYGDEKN